MPQTFRDLNGVDYDVTITVGAAMRVKEATGVSLYALSEDGFKGMGELLGDLGKFVAVMFVLAKRRDGKPIESPEAFADGLAGDSLDGAGNAFVQALCDFFPNPAAREALRRVVTTGKSLQAKVAAKAMAKMDAETSEEQLDKAADQIIGNLGAPSLAPNSSDSSGTAPVSSESTPATPTSGPSGN